MSLVFCTHSIYIVYIPQKWLGSLSIMAIICLLEGTTMAVDKPIYIYPWPWTNPYMYTFTHIFFSVYIIYLCVCLVTAQLNQDWIFCVLALGELFIRMCAQGLHFFYEACGHCGRDPKVGSFDPQKPLDSADSSMLASYTGHMHQICLHLSRCFLQNTLAVIENLTRKTRRWSHPEPPGPLEMECV